MFSLSVKILKIMNETEKSYTSKVEDEGNNNIDRKLDKKEKLKDWLVIFRKPPRRAFKELFDFESYPVLALRRVSNVNAFIVGLILITFSINSWCKYQEIIESKKNEVRQEIATIIEDLRINMGQEENMLGIGAELSNTYKILKSQEIEFEIIQPSPETPKDSELENYDKLTTAHRIAIKRALEELSIEEFIEQLLKSSKGRQLAVLLELYNEHPELYGDKTWRIFRPKEKYLKLYEEFRNFPDKRILLGESFKTKLNKSGYQNVAPIITLAEFEKLADTFEKDADLEKNTKIYEVKVGNKLTIVGELYRKGVCLRCHVAMVAKQDKKKKKEKEHLPLLLKFEVNLSKDTSNLKDTFQYALFWILLLGVIAFAVPRGANRWIVTPAYKKLHEYADEMEELAEERSKQLIQADRLVILGTMSAGVAHEINNPNTFIGANIQILEKLWKTCLQALIEEGSKAKSGDKKLKFASEEIPKMIESMKEGSKRISTIVNSLKGFSRKTDAEFIFKSVNICECIEDAVKFCQFDKTLKHKIKIQRALPKDLPNILLNEHEIGQVLINLFTNAAHAMENQNNATLKVSAAKAGDDIVIKVIDNGNGMDKKTAGKIFDPFFTTKDRSAGTGLGLSISYSIIDKHRGTIDLESVQGKGTTFTITLPIDPQEKERRIKEGGLYGGLRNGDPEIK